MGFTYGSDYYDPSEPTEEEEPSKQRGKRGALPGGVGQCCTRSAKVFRTQVRRPSPENITVTHRTLVAFLLRVEN